MASTLVTFLDTFLVAFLVMLTVLFELTFLDELVEAWRNVLKRAKLNSHHKLGRAELSVREHMSGVLRRLQTDGMCEFSQLFDLNEGGLPKLVVIFLAILELAKEGLIKITQQAAFSTIYLQVSHAE